MRALATCFIFLGSRPSDLHLPIAARQPISSTNLPNAARRSPFGEPISSRLLPVKPSSFPSQIQADKSRIFFLLMENKSHDWELSVEVHSPQPSLNEDRRARRAWFCRWLRSWSAVLVSDVVLRRARLIFSILVSSVAELVVLHLVFRSQSTSITVLSVAEIVERCSLTVVSKLLENMECQIVVVAAAVGCQIFAFGEHGMPDIYSCY
ncbi:hypothetical protein KSP39_PZI009785 [Platanthera zijinensis]|uniref:Uncharacterized protein n=1 Tax=Platanthera zijinensis TaxID=2320716 RepID=A0AAP0BIM0_9ASPA